MNKKQRQVEQMYADATDFNAANVRLLRRLLATVASKDRFNKSDIPTQLDAQIDLTTDSMNIINLN